ncbi:MAG TPA: hypothetical protein DCZ10_07500 [Pelotomaculum sp.]|nr:hypothetical protein [Pelotomaculum sp.]
MIAIVKNTALSGLDQIVEPKRIMKRFSKSIFLKPEKNRLLLIVDGLIFPVHIPLSPVHGSD